jgi:hypothetical protein
MKRFIDALGSLHASLWLSGLLVIMLAAGAVVMPLSERFRSIHDLPLLRWMPEQPFGVTWWLWGAIGVLCLLTVNTLLCSIDSLRKKTSRARWLLVISPQVIHIGFLLMLVAHLVSGVGGYKSLVVAGEDTAFQLPDGTAVRIVAIDLAIDDSGHLRDWVLGIEYFSEGKKLRIDSIRPNSPSFHGSTGIYVKDLQAYPRKLALVEIAREPGALWALAGSVFFMAGTITLVALRMRREAAAEDSLRQK